MLVVVSSVLAGLLLLVVLGFLKLIHDIRMHALREAKKSLDEHFLYLDQFIKDPASPPHLSEFALLVSNASKDPKFGKFAKEYVDNPSPARKSSNKASAEPVLNQLKELERHRPDLVRSFNLALTGAFFCALYRHVADEMSPFKVYKDAKAAQAAESNRRSEGASSAVFSAEIYGWCEVA